MRSGAVQGRRGHHERIGRKVHGDAAVRGERAEARHRPTGLADHDGARIARPTDDRRSPVEALRQRVNRAVHGRDEHDPKRERIRGRRVRDRDRHPTTVGRPRRAALGRRRRDERPGSARRDVHHRHVGPHPIVPRRRGRVREGDRGAVRRPVERGTTHPRTHMPAHLHVLRREQPGDPPPPRSIPCHVDQVEAREPLGLAHHARVAHRHGRVREHERHPAAIRRPAKLTQLPLPGHVREPLRPPRAVERHTPHVPLPRPARGEREPAPVRRPGRGARRRLDPPGGLLPGAAHGIQVHGRPPLTRLRLHERLGHLDRRPAPVR